MINNAVFGKTMENVRKQEREREKNKTKQKTTKIKKQKQKREILMNKPVHLGLSILELSKILIPEFWFDYVKPKYGEKSKLFCMDTDSFIVYIKADEIYKDIAEDVEIRFDTSNYELDRLLPKGKNKKVTGLMKDKLGGQIMTKIDGLKVKTYGLKTQQRFQSEGHNVFTEKINKTALSSNDDERRQSIDLIETYECGTGKDLVIEKEEIKCNNIIISYKKWLTLMML